MPIGVAKNLGEILTGKHTQLITIAITGGATVLRAGAGHTTMLNATSRERERERERERAEHF